MANGIGNSWSWIGFSIFLVIALGIDSYVLNKPRYGAYHSMRAALSWTLLWVFSALLFNLMLWRYLLATTSPTFANEKAMDFLAGYIIEKFLSVDNLFVFYMIFNQFRIPLPFQQRIFSYGIWGAVVFRLLLILAGTWLVVRFHWLLYIMGAILLATGIRMMFVSHEEKNLSTSGLFRLLKRFLPVTDEIRGKRFFIRKNKALVATPLFIALIFIEFSDLVFAFDSIPAIFAITTDPFIIWTSNIFAILGLRALYFLLEGMIRRFALLKYAIALILVFVGVKMLVAHWIAIPVGVSLGVIVGLLLLVGIITWAR